MVHKDYFRNRGIPIPTIVTSLPKNLRSLPAILGVCLLFAIQPGLAQNGNGGCETAWAWNESSVCFNELEGCNIKKWGFTTQGSPGGEPFGIDEFDVIESAPGLCNPNGSEGNDVGDITVIWSNPPEIQIELDEHVATEVHIWIGCSPLPTNGSKCTAAPGQLGCTYEFDEPESNITIDDCGAPCGEGTTWIAIHLVTCDEEDENQEGSLVRFENTSFDAREERSTSSIDVSAYPNPATDQIAVDIAGHVSGEVEVTLLNQFGRIVKTMTVNVIDGEQPSFNITNDVPDGVYYVRVGNQEAVELTKVLVLKQK